jgi:NDP-4-keto-2,6-dideoxyhexose 3-C-methyltransferase
MLYDLPDPMGFIQSIHASLQDGGYWLCEQSDLELMLEANSFDTICHEHLEYYSRDLLINLASRIGFENVYEAVNVANGGSRRIVFKKATDGNYYDQVLSCSARTILDQQERFELLMARTQKLRETLTSELESKRYHGLGASTKGNTLLQVLNISQELLPYVAEVNAAKIGRHTPGTRIPIISEEESASHAPDGWLVLPWHFREFFIERLDRGRWSRLTFPLPNLEIFKAK